MLMDLSHENLQRRDRKKKYKNDANYFYLLSVFETAVYVSSINYFNGDDNR